MKKISLSVVFLLWVTIVLAQQPDNNIPQPQFEKVDEVNIVFPE